MNDKLREMISTAISSGATALLPIVIKTPESAIFAASLNPLLSCAVDSIFTDMASNILSKNECKRLGVSYITVVNKVNSNFNKGLIVRTDDFFDKETQSLKASEIIEGVVKNTLNDTNIKKSQYYANFLGNIGFSNFQVDQDYARFLLKTLGNLSYRQLCVLRYYKKYRNLNLSKWSGYFERGSVNAQGLDLYTEILQLRSLNLIKACGPISLGVDLGNSELSRSGDILYRFFDLEEILPADLEELSIIINNIQKAID